MAGILYPPTSGPFGATGITSSSTRPQIPLRSICAGYGCVMPIEKNMEVNICTDEHVLIKSIENLSLKSRGIVSIDGVDGVGKSRLAYKITKELSLPHIGIDTFVQEQQGGYINHIDYVRLSERIREDLIAYRLVILEGICMEQVLKKICLNSYVRIYVKVIDSYGFWMDKIRFFPPEKSADEVIAERKAKGFSLGHMEEIIRYHYICKPHENADYIFERRKA